MQRTSEKVLDAVKVLFDEKGYPPTVRELGDYVGLKSSGSVQRHLNKLRDNGKVTWISSLPRTIRVVEEWENNTPLS